MKKLTAFLATSLLSLSAQAYMLDFTDSTVGETGSFVGSSYKVESTGTGGGLTRTDFDGNGALSPCTFLACENDGFGVTDDEVSGTESVTISFNSDITVSGLFFLDLFTTKFGTEKVDVEFSGGEMFSILASDPSFNAGYAALTGIKVKTSWIKFTAEDLFGDDATNDFAIAGISAVPVPAAAFLFAPALVGFMGLRRKAKKA